MSSVPYFVPAGGIATDFRFLENWYGDKHMKSALQLMMVSARDIMSIIFCFLAKKGTCRGGG